jgi:uncharacterized protein (DUF302 family)
MKVDEGFESFRDRFEASVPSFDLTGLLELVARRAPWDEVVHQIAEIAPYGFLCYWRADVGPVMSLAGQTAKCTTYLIGNHAVALRMFRVDPAAMLYAPLRTLLYEARTGETRFVVDQPSSAFDSLRNVDIAEVGIEIDEKLASLVDALGIAPPRELRRAKNQPARTTT